MIERGPGQHFHHEKNGFVGTSDEVGNLDDVWVLQHRDRLRFTLESRDDLGSTRERIVEELDGYAPPSEVFLNSFVYGPHPSLADQHADPESAAKKFAGPGAARPEGCAATCRVGRCFGRPRLLG